MTKHYRPSVFLSGKRDANERGIMAMLNRFGVAFCMMPPTAGFDLLVFNGRVELWEVKNSSVKWTLTKAEHERKQYCKEHGIIYRVIETLEQAADALVERI